MLKKLLLSLLLSVSYFTAFAEEVTLYGDEHYAPMLYTEGLKAKGIFVDLLRALERITGDKYNIVLLPWVKAKYASEQGTGGIMIFSFNVERATKYDFSDPLLNDNIYLVTLTKNQFKFDLLTDLKGKLVGGANGASYGDEIDNLIAKGLFTVDRDPNNSIRMRKLLNERFDAALISRAPETLPYLFARDPELAASRDKFYIQPKVLVNDPLHIAFLKTMNKKPVIERLNKALAQFKKTKEYTAIISQ